MNSECLFRATTEKSPEQTIEKLQDLSVGLETRVHLFFGNWDNDERELYDIPEVQRWCRRFIELGGMSLISRVEDMHGEITAFNMPSQFLVAACAGAAGAERLGPRLFSYNEKEIARVEKENQA